MSRRWNEYMAAGMTAPQVGLIDRLARDLGLSSGGDLAASVLGAKTIRKIGISSADASRIIDEAKARIEAAKKAAAVEADRLASGGRRDDDIARISATLGASATAEVRAALAAAWEAGLAAAHEAE